MFEFLSDKFEGAFKKLRGQSTLTEKNVQEALREVRLALLSADVNHKVVKSFISAVQTSAMGKEVLKGVNPAEQFVKIVHDELTAMLEGTEKDRPFVVQPDKMNIIMMLGLQGAGKTTFCGKIANHLKDEHCKPLLVACDIYRPAAIDQLKAVADRVNTPVFEMGTEKPVVEIIRGAVEHAKKNGHDTLILDTAGRLHIDEVKMDELLAVKGEFNPDYVFLVADAMTGQDAVNSARAFNEEVGIDGVCLTKLDGDARGGAALSIKAVTGKPIVFAGVGEKPEDLEKFHPDRIAKRILGMGDVVSLVEKAQTAIDEKEAMDIQEKMASGTFTFDDFLKQMRTIKKMGPLKGLLGMVPGFGQALKEVDSDQLDNELKRVEAIIQSMTREEREKPELLEKQGNRRGRVAKGAGRDLKDINALVRQFQEMKGMMQQMAGGGMSGGLGNLMGGMNPFGGGFGGGAESGQMPPMPPPGGSMPGIPGAPQSKKMKRLQKAMERQQRIEAGLSKPSQRKKKKRKKKKKR